MKRALLVAALLLTSCAPHQQYRTWFPREEPKEFAIYHELVYPFDETYVLAGAEQLEEQLPAGKSMEDVRQAIRCDVEMRLREGEQLSDLVLRLSEKLGESVPLESLQVYRSGRRGQEPASEASLVPGEMVLGRSYQFTFHDESTYSTGPFCSKKPTDLRAIFAGAE